MLEPFSNALVSITRYAPKVAQRVGARHAVHYPGARHLTFTLKTVGREACLARPPISRSS